MDGKALSAPSDSVDAEEVMCVTYGGSDGSSELANDDDDDDLAVELLERSVESIDDGLATPLI